MSEVPDRAKQWTVVPSPAAQASVVLDDRFEVGELLGEGGASWVYAGVERVLHRRAAIKILKSSDEDTRRRFVDEARILANLRHPHLVHVRAIGETKDGAPYMVLELLPGENLEDRLRERGPLAWREVVQIATQVASALEALHEAGVIHRDVKPGNIVRLHGVTGQPLVKLIDLGIAKVVGDWKLVEGEGFTTSPRRPTADRQVVGTPGFHAPEAGYTQPGPEYDTFALGVTIHLLCTGEMPNLVAPRPMVELRPGSAFPRELEELVADALAVLPEERIATAAEFRRRLAAIHAAHAATPHLFDDCYELLEVLGVGAKAEVHRAYHMDAGRYVALKILSERSAKNPEERRRFAREALVLGATSDPALPELVECRTRRDNPFIAMAQAPGRRASDFCIGERRLRPTDVITVGTQLAGALLALHARGILHRDVHAGNVLVDVGERTTATLVDVGMAHFEDAYYARAQPRYLTPPEARVPLGTGGLERLEWTAPEARASKQWTAKCDVYSLGLLLYKLLTGKVPHKQGALVSPRKFVPDCPPSLESTLLAALANDPAERPDMTGLRAGLDDAADELRGDAPEPEPVRATTPLARPPRWTRELTAAALGGLVTLGLVWLLAPRVPAPAAMQVASLHAADRDSDEAKPPAQTHAAARGPEVADLPVRPLRVREALADAHAALRGCAARTGKLLMVEFTTEADGDRFASVAVSGLADPALSGCVREATTTIRFQPEAAQTFTEEYEP